MRVIYKDIEDSEDKQAVALKLLKNVGVKRIAYTIKATPKEEPIEDTTDSDTTTQRVIIGSGDPITIGIKSIIYIERITLDISSPFSDNAELLIYTPRDIVAVFPIGNKVDLNKFEFTESDVVIHEPYDALKTGVPVMSIDGKYYPMLINNGEECNTVSFKIINNTNDNALANIFIVTKPVPESSGT